jgi:hypothetical protein
MDPLTSGAPIDLLAQTVERLADRLRSLSDVRLARPLPPYASRAEAAHALAQQLADGAASVEERPARLVPRLHDLAVGDQVAVTGQDLVDALRAAGPASDPAARAAAAAVAACRQLAASL